MQPAFDYFQTKFHGDLKPAVSAFKAAQLICPHNVNDLQPDLSTVDRVTAFSFLQDTVLVTNLKAELPQYLACAADLAQEVDSLDWWNQHSTSLPYWSSAASTVLLVQPSSATAEKVFSLFTNTFGDRQNRSLQDYLKTSNVAI